MENNQTSHRIHPVVAGAAASVMLVSLVGVAAITGLLPSSHGTAADSARLASQQAVATPTVVQQHYALVPVAAPQQPSTPVVVREVVEHRTVVHDKYVQRPVATRHQHQPQYAQYDNAPRYSQGPALQQTSASSANSPIGMGIGAVVGGLVGSRVGGGNGKTLATIAGAVGGGYLGNEVAKRYP